MADIHDNLPDEDLILEIKSLEKMADDAKNMLKRAQEVLITRNKDDIAAALAKKTEPFGSVSAEIGGKKVTFNTPKKVEWDQEGLASLYAQILSDPEENVRDYITVEYKVKEEAYKNWPTPIKEAFEPHRTLKSGSVSVKIEDLKE